MTGQRSRALARWSECTEAQGRQFLALLLSAWLLVQLVEDARWSPVAVWLSHLLLLSLLCAFPLWVVQRVQLAGEAAGRPE